MEQLKIAVRRTLCYLDIFNHSPSQEEIYQYLIGYKCSFSDLKPLLGRYPLKKKQPLLLRQKICAANRFAVLAGKFCGVEGVFLTGDLAAGAARKNSDADFLVVTKKGWLFPVRWGLTVIFSLLCLRRSRFNLRLRKKATACFNIFLEENSLYMPNEKRNLFVAQEIARLKPLVDKGSCYQKFLTANVWVLDFLPNLLEALRLSEREQEIPCRPAAAKTTGQLFLHTKDLTRSILRRYKENCQKEGITPGKIYDT